MRSVRPGRRRDLPGASRAAPRARGVPAPWAAAARGGRAGASGRDVHGPVRASAPRSRRSRRTRTTQPTGTPAAKSHHWTAYAMWGPMLSWSGSGIGSGCARPAGEGEVETSST